MKLATSMQQQWIDLENKRLDAEKQERERERQHELQMMQLLSSMFNANSLHVHQQQIIAQSESQYHQPTFTDISNSTPSADYFPRFLFLLKLCLFIVEFAIYIEVNIDYILC